MSALVAVDAFSGTGWGVALREYGVVEHGIDTMPEVRATRLANGLGVADFDDVWEGLARPSLVPDHDLYLASPPCQTFSRVGKGSGRKALDDVLSMVRSGTFVSPSQMRAFAAIVGDERTALVLAPLAHVVAWRPRFVAWEQVPPVLPVWEACAEVLRSLGYSVWTGVLTSEQYGVPQTRRRAVLMASLAGDVAPPTPTHSRFHSRSPERIDLGVPRWVSMAEALGWGTEEVVGFPRRDDGRDEGIVLDGERYRARDMRSADLPSQAVTSKARSWERHAPHGEGTAMLSAGPGAEERVGQRPRLPEEPSATITGARSAYWIDRELLAEKVRERANDQSGTAFDATWPADRPALTIAGRDLVPHPGATANRHNGSTKSRNDGIRVTVEEAAILQSYPRGFAFEGTKTKRFEQVGNAVPPRLADAILVALCGEALTG